MRIPRAFVGQRLAPGRLTLPPGPSQHLVQVLRLRPGDELVLFDGAGSDWPARLVTPEPGGARVEVGPPGPTERPPVLPLTLGLGISRGERMDFALQKAVELGVTRISPLLTSRTVVKLAGDRVERRGRHWLGVITAACEQCGRRRLPVLDAPARLDDWLAAGHAGGLLLDHRSPLPLTDLSAPNVEGVTLLVGPEGGLAPEERERAVQAGFTGVRLGPRVLRTETAPLAALAVIQALWGDLRE
jgi:16S rRNA (uracil1498-N3)-methyltransferase